MNKILIQIRQVFYGSLYTKLASILVLIILTMGFVYGFITFSVTHDYWQESTQKFNRDLAANLVGERDLVVEGKINTQALKQTFHDFMTVNPNIEIYLLDLQGKILSYSAEPGQVKREDVSLGPIKAFFKGDLLPGDDPRSLTVKKAFSVTYIPTRERPEGYLYVVLRGQEFDQVNQVVQNRYLIGYSLVSVGISLVIGLLLGLFLFYSITRRLRSLSSAIQSFTQSGFQNQPDIKAIADSSNDEIGQLAHSFDVMAKHTIMQLKKLEAQDQQRRDLIANVSHDLRTPLASMLGYLETLLLIGKTETWEKRQNYLQIVSRHGKRLERLINDLFELAKLDAREVEPVLEVFSFSEFIYDVAQKFSHKAEQSGIRLELDCPREVLLVNADIAMMERVMDNLISNAFNYTPSGGEIRLIVKKLSSDEIQIYVKDNGCGIDKDELSRIFERFYQADNKHRKGQHAGLGLAIVKRIISLHGSQIHVTSQPEQGTCFDFSLKLVNL